MNEIAKRIIEGEIVCLHEIHENNAQRIFERLKAFQNSPCIKAGGERGCNKNCNHGKSIDKEVSYALEHIDKARSRCTCGEYNENSYGA